MSVLEWTDDMKSAAMADAATVVKQHARIAELEALLREIDGKIVFETSVMDGSGRDLQERIEAALRVAG